jgi:hypothetical protein
MTDAGDSTVVRIVQVRLRSGSHIKTLIEVEQLDVGELHRQLEQAQFVRIGEHTVVRSGDVESLQLMDAERQRHDRRQTRARRGPRVERLIETRPFFLTSEFVLALAAWVALMLTTIATDSIDAVGFWLLSVAIAAGYMLSRGFAKAHAASESWDPREELQPGG